MYSTLFISATPLHTAPSRLVNNLVCNKVHWCSDGQHVTRTLRYAVEDFSPTLRRLTLQPSRSVCACRVASWTASASYHTLEQSTVFMQLSAESIMVVFAGSVTNDYQHLPACTTYSIRQFKAFKQAEHAALWLGFLEQGITAG